MEEQISQQEYREIPTPLLVIVSNVIFNVIQVVYWPSRSNDSFVCVSKYVSHVQSQKVGGFGLYFSILLQICAYLWKIDERMGSFCFVYGVFKEGS